MDKKQTYIVGRLKRFLIDHYTPEMIILYGSTARGDADEFSDIDMMVIMNTGDREKVSAEILKATDHIVNDKHIMLRSVEEYYTQRDIPGTMVFSALREGVILLKRPGFDIDDLPSKSYEERKRDVIGKEYLEQVHEFLERSRKALESKQLFRCRDFLRFAAVRMLKAVMVFRDVHPPRSTDLKTLVEMTQELLPDVEKLKPLIDDLDLYCPAGNDPGEGDRCRKLLDNVRYFINILAKKICLN